LKKRSKKLYIPAHGTVLFCKKEHFCLPASCWISATLSFGSSVAQRFTFHSPASQANDYHTLSNGIAETTKRGVSRALTIL
jgi:hypothetical protein